MGIADVTQAQLAREQWNRYKQQFLPMLQGLSEDLLTDARLTEMLEQTPGAIEQSYEKQAESLAAQRSRMGIDTELSQTAKTQTDISKAKSQAGAENLLRQSYEDMKNQAILGSSGSLGSIGG